MHTKSSKSQPSHQRPWHEIAQEQYRQQRYLEHLTDKQLTQRARDVFMNLTVLTKECKIGLSDSPRDRLYWNVLWSDVIEEFNLRCGGFIADASFVKELRIPRPDTDQARRSAHLVRTTKVHLGKTLFKYGELKFLLPALERGVVRVQRASYYSDASLNHAQHADELTLEAQPPPWLLTTTVKDRATGNLRRILPINNRFTVESSTDYYVFCLSGAFSPRLFVDFEADSCLIISEPHRFIERLMAAFSQKCLGYEAHAFPVLYCDPISVRSIDLHPTISKHFRYSYQSEARVIWIPECPCPRLQEPVDLEIGSLADICRLAAI